MRETVLLAEHESPQRTMTVEDGVAVPAVFSTRDAEVDAIRRCVAVSDLSHVVVLRVGGAQAHDVLDRLVPCDLFLRRGEIRHTLVLRRDGTVAADLYVGRDAGHYLLFAEGITAEGLLASLEQVKLTGDEVLIDRLSDSHTLLSINGPFAWELLSVYDSPGAIGLPYRTFYQPEPGVLCLRGGKTGEFGYDLLVRDEAAADHWNRLLDLARSFEGIPAGLDAIDYCGLENWFFNARREGRRHLDPRQLQLQWRLEPGKDAWGREGFELRRGESGQRLTAFAAAEALQPGVPIHFDDSEIGEILRVAPRHRGTGTLGLALLDLAFAHAGIDRYTVPHQGSTVPIQTLSPPFVTNRSLFVKPLEHGWSSREEITYPANVG